MQKICCIFHLSMGLSPLVCSRRHSGIVSVLPQCDHDRDVIVKRHEGANVHKNVRGVPETLNRRLLFRRGVDEPTESFSINHHGSEERRRWGDGGGMRAKKWEIAKAININSEWLPHNRSELFPGHSAG